MTWPPALLDAVHPALLSLGLAPPCRVAGLPPPLVPLVLAHLSRRERLPVLAAFRHEEAAMAAREGLLGAMAAEDDLAFYPLAAGDDAPPGFDSPQEGLRQAALARLAVIPPPSFFLCTTALWDAGLPPPTSLAAAALTVRPGENSYDGLRHWCAENDYESVPLVTEPGTYAVRGGILDCYPVNLPAPVRLDFDGDVLEVIRVFDIHSQTSTGTLRQATLLSLAPAPSGSVPLHQHFPHGWIQLLQEEEDVWMLSSHHRSPGPPGEVDLQGEPFPPGAPEPSALAARWERLSLAHDAPQALVVSDRDAHVAHLQSTLPQLPLHHLEGLYPAGFSALALGLLVLTPAELSPRSVADWRPRPQGVASLATIRRHLDTLEPGDPLVHINYGIGRYEGLIDLPVGSETQECLAIQYAGNDRVYVSTDHIGLVFPYSFHGDGAPPLDDLNSRRWDRVRQRTRRSAEEVVDQLAELYARREAASGIAHAAQDDLQADLEATFPYTDTTDQVRAMEEIKADMEAPRPMDRLLCGDVGFGKTELALRAAFMAVRGGYQVALMAPTTILADQHFISFRARLEPFAVRVEMLSRFVPPARQRQTLQALANGSVDLLIGTHRLLSKQVVFKRLGLLIVDEEHRFGVRQKERLKDLKTSVDVLSLSATPIPRTLHFSLAGIRDISRLDTPPLQRIPIRTSVNYFSTALIRTAIQKELQRGGQVYFVHSDVRGIDRQARDLREVLPEVTFAVAHGQQPARELETTMLAFAEGRFQVLVCTSIIESGIDLPNVNTVIINNAHRFGLAQTYQIRGRVGRSNRQAYAYLLIPRRPRPTPAALKRLKTIERHTALGSGYAIALKDLEIRGTGNLFGLEQSGHVAAVGLDLYTRIVRDIARERQLSAEDAAQPSLPREQVTIRLEPDARIPEDYVDDPHLRLNLYRRLAALDNSEDLRQFRLELVDRFGPLPTRLTGLLNTARLALLAMDLGIKAVRLTPAGHLTLDFLPTDAPATHLAHIQGLLEPAGHEYRFVNLKGGELRVDLDIAADGPYTVAEEFMLGLASKKTAAPVPPNR